MSNVPMEGSKSGCVQVIVELAEGRWTAICPVKSRIGK